MANLAVKVADLDAACAFYERAGGRGPRPHGVERRRARRRVPRAGADHAVHPRDLRGRGRRCPPRASCTRRCSPTTSTPSSTGHDGACWGPEIVEGPFGRRRIAFVDAPGGIRLEFMEQLERSTMKVTRFHHVSVNCHDAPLDDMVAFYGGLLGLADVPRPEIPGVAGHWHARRRPAAAPRRRAAARARRSTPPATTTASRSTTSTPPSPSSRRSGIEYKRGVQGESERADLDQRPGRQHHRAPTGDPERRDASLPTTVRSAPRSSASAASTTSTCARYLDNPDVEVVALVDPSEERRAERQARLARRARRSRRSAELAASGLEVDAVEALLPIPLHVDGVIELLGHGWHVNLQKPMCNDLADAQRMLDAARRPTTACCG